MAISNLPDEAKIIVDTAARAGVVVDCVEFHHGAAFSRYVFKVLNKSANAIKKCKDEIRIALGADIMMNVTGPSQVEIDVENKNRSVVYFDEVLDSDAFKQADGKLVFALGQDVYGKYIVEDLAKMPHLLVAGVSGSGKSTLLHCLILSLMKKYSPNYVRFVLFDPKMFEFSVYNGTPHLATGSAVTLVDDMLNYLETICTEMERRFALFAQAGARDISSYDAAVVEDERLPYIVLVVDELADIMTVVRKKFEEYLSKICTKGRSCGIHVVLATQRPSADVVSGTVKANIPSKIALKVSSEYDSRTILGTGGAEALCGRGDMLVQTMSSQTLERVQGAYVSMGEIRDFADLLRQSTACDASMDDVIDIDVHENTIYEQLKDLNEFIEKLKKDIADGDEQPAAIVSDPAPSDVDPLCKDVLRFGIEENGGYITIAAIQRKFRLGFNRAGRILSTLEDMNCVDGGAEKFKRKVLVALENLDVLFPDSEQ